MAQEDPDIDFKTAMQGVKRLGSNENVHIPAAKPPGKPLAKPGMRSAKTQIAQGIATQRNDPGATELFFLRAGYPRKALQQLKQANFASFDAQIDLHGLGARQAQRALHQFLSQCQQQQATYGLIVHGKGLHSGCEPVIKNLVEAALTDHAAIAAFCSARPVDGGTGALYVLFKRG